MTLALFDLDNTLLNGDSDHAWGIFLGQVGALDPIEQEKKQDHFYQQYVKGELDIHEYLDYQLAILAEFPIQQLLDWREQFLQEIIEPMIVSGKRDILEPHRRGDDKLVIITATADFITKPIADRLGVDTLIASTAEMIDGAYTGHATNTPCMGQGKVTRLTEWLKDDEHNLQGSWFYSDSYNDLPLLLHCDNPVAVTPDERLRAYAKQSGWRIID